MTSDVQQLEQLAADAEAKATSAREKMGLEREKEREKRRKRERDLDRQILATANETRERLGDESKAAYAAVLLAAEQNPLVQAVAAFRAAKVSEWTFVSEMQNASIRLGRPYSPYEPERREIALVDMLDQGTRNLASRLSAEAEEAHAAEREAHLDGTADEAA